MKIINIDVNDEIILNNIEDLNTGTIKSINSKLKLPTGNYQNILLNFNFISPIPEEDLKLIATFLIGNNSVDVTITSIKVNNKTYLYACYIPPEVFEEPCDVALGLYGFKLDENENLVKRISLIPIANEVVKGSYNPDSKESVVPSPTVFEVYFNKIDNAYDEFNNFVQSLKTKHFNSVAEMKADNTLIDGYVVETLGYHEVNDGGGATYLIRTKTSNDVEDDRYIIFTSNDLVAELIKNNEMIEDITCEEFTDTTTDTKYWITHIPHKDKYGNVLRLRLGLADDSMEQTGHLETAREFAHRHKASLVINAGIGDNASNEMTGQKLGLRMKDGVFISNVPFSYWQIHWALGIKEDNTLVTFGTTQTEEQARELGCVDVTSAMTPILLNGISQKFNIQYTNSWFTATITTDETPNANKTYYTKNTTAPYYTKHTNLSVFTSGVTYYEIEDYLYQKQMIGQNTTTKDIYVITCNGKGVGKDRGMSTDKIVEIFLSLGCDFAYQLDGGGSTALVYHGEMLNNPTDDEGKTERPCADFLYVSYEDLSPYSDELNDINKRISDIKRRTQRLETMYLDVRDNIPEGYDLNNINKTGKYCCLNRYVAETLQNLPDISKFPTYKGKTIYGFKLTVEKMNSNNVLIQTLICEGGGLNKGVTPIFVRQYSHDGTSYTWREWKLIGFNETSKITPTIETDFTLANDNFYCKNNRVCINFEVNGTFVQNTNTKILTLPSEYKPSKYVITACVCHTGNNIVVGQVQITTTGELKITTSADASKVRCNIVYDLES